MIGTTGCLVLGDIFPAAAQVARLRNLTGPVSLIPDAARRDVTADIAAARFVIACNVDLRPYLDILVGTELTVLAETGIVCLDPVAAARAGVRFVNIESYSVQSVTEYILRCLLESVRPWPAVFAPWAPGPRDHKIGDNLASRRIGLIGFGRIGRRLADILLGLGVTVEATADHPFAHPAVPYRSVDQILAEADMIVVCCSLGTSSRGMLTAERLSTLKSGAILASIAHEAVFDLDGLKTVLALRRDVTVWLDHDPSAASTELTSLDNVRLSPHLAFFSRQTLTARIDQCIGRIEAHLIAPDFGVTKDDVPQAVAAMDRVLELASDFYRSAALFAALRLGVFGAVADAPLAALEIARSVAGDPMLIERLAEALASSGLLERRGERFALPDALRPALDEHSGYCVIPGLAVLGDYVYPAWSRLAEAVRNDRSATLQGLRSSDRSAAARLTAASDSLTRPVAARAMAYLGGPAVKRIVDLGCGSAAITRALLCRFTDAEAILVDTPLVLEVTRGYADRDGVASRCTLVPADLAAGFRPPDGADLIILSNVLHTLPNSTGHRIVADSAAGLTSNGCLAIIGYCGGEDRSSTAFFQHFSLSCSFLSPGDGCPTQTMLEEWLRRAGLIVLKVPLTRHISLTLGRRAF